MNYYRLFVFISCVIFTVACSSGKYIYVKVERAAILPDSLELQRDSLIIGAVKIGKFAERYYNKDKIYGGGEGTFNNLVIPSYMLSTNNATYIITKVTHALVLVGIGNSYGYDNNSPMKIELVVTPDGIEDLIILN